MNTNTCDTSQLFSLPPWHPHKLIQVIIFSPLASHSIKTQLFGYELFQLSLFQTPQPTFLLCSSLTFFPSLPFFFYPLNTWYSLLVMFIVLLLFLHGFESSRCLCLYSLSYLLSKQILQTYLEQSRLQTIHLVLKPQFIHI